MIRVHNTYGRTHWGLIDDRPPLALQVGHSQPTRS